MAKEITEFINNEIYPALYSNIVNALPEFNFKKTHKGYVSTTDVIIYGDKAKAGKVYIYENNMKGLKAYNIAKNYIPLWDYIKNTYNCSSNKEILIKLAELSGVTLPKGDFNEDEYIKHKRISQLWEEVNNYFIWSLENAKGKAQAVREYLKKRGYTPEDVKAMELGYIPSQAQLIKYLKDKGFTQEEINVIQLNKAIGETHSLTIPLREPVGDIIGFTVRNINFKLGDKIGKYLNSTGLSKTDKLFNLRALKGKKDLILVEGLLDCLLASARGIENIVALGGKSFNKAQLQTAIKYGAQKITICLDNEPETTDNILSTIDVIKNNSELKVYVALLPDKIKDIDELIRKKGEEAVKPVIDEAIPYYEYQLQHIINKYSDRGLTAKEEDEFIEEIVITASSIDEPIDRDRYIKTFTSLDEVKDLGISESSLEEAAERIKFEKDKETQKKKLRALLDEAKALQDKGETLKALDLITSGTREIKQESSKLTFESLLIPPTEEEIRERISKKPESIDSGFKINKEENLLLHSGAITIIAAPTSHCKTTVLLNMAINTATKYKDKQFHIFSYEEDRDTVLLKALNIFVNMKYGKNNLRILKSYYSASPDERYKYFEKYFKTKEFEENKNYFLKELINTQRLNIHYIDYSSDTLLEAIEFINKRQPVGAVYIDYMQLLRKEKGKYNRREEELKAICLELKDLAVDTGLPIILAAQFNRQVINHSLIHPTNIGEAGDIERVANTIVGLWNNNFKPLNLTDKGFINDYCIDNTIYGKVLKMREGKVGSEFLLNFKGNTGKIENREETKY